MKLRLAVVFSALVGVGLSADPSPSFAQLKDRIEEARKQAEQKRKAEQKASPKPEPKAGKGKKKRWTEHVKGQKKGQNK
jgi:hypothetical protein